MQICAGIIHNHSFRFPPPQNILSQPLHKAVIIILNFEHFMGIFAYLFPFLSCSIYVAFIFIFHS